MPQLDPERVSHWDHGITILARIDPLKAAKTFGLGGGFGFRFLFLSAQTSKRITPNKMINTAFSMLFFLIYSCRIQGGSNLLIIFNTVGFSLAGLLFKRMFLKNIVHTGFFSFGLFFDRD